MTTDANALIALANGFQRISDPLTAARVMIYLLQSIAGNSMTPQQLITAVSGVSPADYQRIDNQLLAKRIIVYLLAQISNNGGSGSIQDMEIAWTPTSVKLGELIGFDTDIQGIGNPTLSGITTLTFKQASSIGGMVINGTSATSISFPNLTTVDPSNTVFGSIAFSSNPALTSVSWPNLKTVAGLIFLGGGNGLTSISIPALTSVGGLTVQNEGLTSISAPNLVTVGGNGVQISNNPNLTSIDLSSYVPLNGVGDVYQNDALTAASVNAILHRYVANPAFVTGAITLDGGTNAAPTGQGLADKATLIGRGVTVNTN